MGWGGKNADKAVFAAVGSDPWGRQRGRSFRRWQFVWRCGCRQGGCWRRCPLGQGPGPVPAGQAVLEEGAQVDRGASSAEPGVVVGDAEVAQLDPPPVLGGGPSDDPLDGRAGGVGLLEFRGAGLGAGGASSAQRNGTIVLTLSRRAKTTRSPSRFGVVTCADRTRRGSATGYPLRSTCHPTERSGVLSTSCTKGR